MTRADMRRDLRVARTKEGATEKQIARPRAEVLLAMGLLREVTLRVAISGAVIERRYKLTARGEFWLDDDADPAPDLPDEEDERTGT